jgi:F-type H+-transporting ATPase subunit epsilon
MYDGQLGIMRDRAPLIGRLGYGTLRLQTAAGPEKYYVDGGFAHVENDVVNVLTARTIPVDLLDGQEASDALEAALEMPSTTPEEARLRETAVLRARGQLRASR